MLQNWLDKEMVDIFQAAEESIAASQDWEFPKVFTFKWRDFILERNVFSPIHFNSNEVLFM